MFVVAFISRNSVLSYCTVLIFCSNKANKMMLLFCNCHNATVHQKMKTPLMQNKETKNSQFSRL